MPIVVFAADRDDVLTLAEGSGLGRVGLDPSHMVGHTFAELLPEVAQTFRAHHQRVLAGAEFATTAGVRGRTWDLRYVPTRDGRGDVNGFCAIGLDVTERMRFEMDLAATRRREVGVAELSRAALAGAVVSDLMQAAVNLVAHELPGVDYVGLGELTPNGVRRLTAVGIAPDQFQVMLAPEPAAYSAMQSIRAGQSVIVVDWETEARFSRPDWLQLESVKSSAFLPIVSRPNDHVYGFLGAHARRARLFPEHEIVFLETVANLLGDVIARQQAQDAAAQQAEQFRALAENCPDIIARFDRDLRLVYVNGAVERLTGASAGGLIGLTAREAGMKQPQVSALELAFRQVLNTGSNRSLAFDVQTVLGPRTFQARMAPEFGADGVVQSIVVSARDSTDSQRADQERLLVDQQLLAQQNDLHELTARLIDSHQQELYKAAAEMRLTQRERQILSFIARGWTNQEIATELRLSRGNIKNQVSRVLQKLDVSDRTQAAAEAVRLGLLESASARGFRSFTPTVHVEPSTPGDT